VCSQDMMAAREVITLRHSNTLNLMELSLKLINPILEHTRLEINVHQTPDTKETI